MKGKSNPLVLFLLCLIMTVVTACTTINQNMASQSGSSLEEQKLKEEPARKKSLNEQTVQKKDIKRNHTSFNVDRSVPAPMYLVAQLNIHDRSRYAQYVAGFMEILARYGGRLLSVDESPELLEGKWNFTRTVLLEFPSGAAAKSWYHSEEYQRLAQHRFASADTNLVLIKGR